MKRISFIEAVIVLALVFITVGILAGCNMTYSEGSRVGIVQKLSYKGLLCKSWEGEMRVAAQNVLQPETFEFSVMDSEVHHKIHEAMKSGATVELVYKQLAFRSPCNGKTNYQIIDVK